MTSQTKSRRVMFLETITHYLAAMVIFMKGFDKIEQFGKLWLGALFIFFAIVIVLGTMFHHKAAKVFRHLKAYIMAIEAIVMGIVGYLYVTEGKTAIQYVCFAASIMFFIAVLVYIRNTKKVGAHA